MADSAVQPVRVWDLPTRLFHWLLALTIVGSFVTGNLGGNAMVWHFRCGYLVLALLAFRLLWGLVGGRWSRFASFVYAPATLLRYLRGRSRPGEHLEVGHSPLGSLSVFALLGFLAVQVGTGLVADDEIANVGPLNRYVEAATGLAATHWHKAWGSKILFGLVLLHVAAVLYYLLKKKTNLVRPMLTGDKSLPSGVPPSADDWAMRLLALTLALACAAAAAWVVTHAG
jgi:cytochrome b